ncbi:MAG: PAS domain-containing protein [Bdellovibrionaceae bacterium]|nr:PAS domain-containing protein [Pseudobdellovibrionaceae bacterium]
MNAGDLNPKDSELKPIGPSGFDFSKSRTQMVIISAVRLGFHVAILAIILGFQALQPEFVNFEVLQPVYILMAVAFVINATYLVLFDEALNKWPITAFLFFFESAFITGLIHYTGVNQSIFLFLYLVNIILCGFVFQRRGANILSLWTSALFSLLMIMGPELRGQALFFAVGLNNIAFFAVAGLAGYLSEQLDFMGRSLEAQGKDLRALRNLQALIVDNMATGLITVDEKGVCLQANRAAFDILDPIPRELVGRRIETLMPDVMQEIVKPADESATAHRVDWVYQSPMQGRLTLELVVSRLPAETALNGYIVTFHDLTRVRRLEFAMRQSEKMAAVGQLAAGIAHEIRNPLASMSGSIQLLESSFPNAESEERRLMKIVIREIDRLNNLITEFLDFVRPDVLRDDPVDLNSLLRDVMEMCRLNPSLRKDVVQVIDLQATRSIPGNRDKLKQAILNIVINAYQAMNDQSEVKEPKIVIKTIDREHAVVLTIRDHGCGMDEVGLRRMFEPFHTTKPKGTGLGLAITHKIIESHAGRIFVESTKGVGTEFTLEFHLKPNDVRQISLADSERANEDFSRAFRGQKRS